MFKSTFSTISRFESFEIRYLKRFALLRRLEKVDSGEMDVPEILSLEAFPNRCKNGRFGGRYGHFFVFCGVGYAKVQMYGNVGLNAFTFTDSIMLVLKHFWTPIGQSFRMF